MEKLTPLFNTIEQFYKERAIDQKTFEIMKGFLKSYVQTGLESGMPLNKIIEIFTVYLGRLQYLHENPFHFEPYHEHILKPFDYYKFGQDFVTPLVNKEKSQLKGEDHLQEIQSRIDEGQNVILIANHQTEIDPQLITLLIEKKHGALAKEMIFVAGDRVILDHLAIPVSMGRNLLCIYSKKHINNPPEQMEKKRLHNKKTMELMSNLLKEGGKCIYVAPSGGRDRPDKQGNFPVSPIDPQSVEMFYLMTQKAKTPSHFYSLALLTHKVLPPPNDVGIELGEDRNTSYSGVYCYFGKEIDMINFSSQEYTNKIERRHARSDFIWNQINNDYQTLKKLEGQHE